MIIDKKKEYFCDDDNGLVRDLIGNLYWNLENIFSCDKKKKIYFLIGY